MPSLTLLSFSIIPLVILLIPRWIEPYSLLDYKVLNVRPDPQEGCRTTAWFNMGWWENTDSFPDAAEALAQKLLDLAYEGGYEGGGSVLDIGHGAGESLVLHLSQPVPPQHLYGLTSLSSDTSASRALIDDLFPAEKRTTDVSFFTFSAEFRPGKDVGHPLDRMRGYLDEEEESEDEGAPDGVDLGFEIQSPEKDREIATSDSGSSPPPYDLIYILDSIYHYPPSLPSFLTTLRPVLSPSSLVVFTDIVPPPSLPRWKALLISYVMKVPFANVYNRPSVSGGSFKKRLEESGWEDVIVEDWSEGVWPRFIENLRARGVFWGVVARVIESAQEEGWKFVGVRARRGER
ncbi:hypothetical protein CI109_101224 [Kwoniella shandongensis]|uniref:S-adenosyl-L-methionine-dependent methyltransferase n=1 Tax=Kwoniella shandongensis TaxID=1734106 RepID=A0AAJ8LFG6_9TREE